MGSGIGDLGRFAIASADLWEVFMSGNWRWCWAMPLVLAGVCAGANPGAASSQATASVPITTTAASSPASAPVVTADYSTPVAAAKTLLTAINVGNFAAVRDALAITGSHTKEIDTLLGAMEASARLQQAAR